MRTTKEQRANTAWPSMKCPHCELEMTPIGSTMGDEEGCPHCGSEVDTLRNPVPDLAADLDDAVERIRDMLPIINELRLNNAIDLNIGLRRELDYHADRLTAFLREPQGEVKHG